MCMADRGRNGVCRQIYESCEDQDDCSTIANCLHFGKNSTGYCSCNKKDIGFVFINIHTKIT